MLNYIMVAGRRAMLSSLFLLPSSSSTHLFFYLFFPPLLFLDLFFLQAPHQLPHKPVRLGRGWNLYRRVIQGHQQVGGRGAEWRRGGLRVYVPARVYVIVRMTVCI